MLLCKGYLLRIGEEKKIYWEGDSLESLKKFPTEIKVNIGHELRRLQEGRAPLNSRPMSSISTGVFELKDRDKSGWYRVLYFTKVKNRVFVLHSFVKKTAKTSKNDLKIASIRLKNLKERVKLELKDGKKEEEGTDKKT